MHRAATPEAAGMVCASSLTIWFEGPARRYHHPAGLAARAAPCSASRREDHLHRRSGAAPDG